MTVVSGVVGSVPDVVPDVVPAVVYKRDRVDLWLKDEEVSWIRYHRIDIDEALIVHYSFQLTIAVVASVPDVVPTVVPDVVPVVVVLLLEFDIHPEVPSVEEDCSQHSSLVSNKLIPSCGKGRALLHVDEGQPQVST